MGYKVRGIWYHLQTKNKHQCIRLGRHVNKFKVPKLSDSSSTRPKITLHRVGLKIVGIKGKKRPNHPVKGGSDLIYIL